MNIHVEAWDGEEAKGLIVHKGDATELSDVLLAVTFHNEMTKLTRSELEAVAGRLLQMVQEKAKVGFEAIDHIVKPRNGIILPTGLNRAQRRARGNT